MQDVSPFTEKSIVSMYSGVTFYIYILFLIIV